MRRDGVERLCGPVGPEPAHDECRGRMQKVVGKATRTEILAVFAIADIRGIDRIKMYFGSWL